MNIQENSECLTSHYIRGIEPYAQKNDQAIAITNILSGIIETLPDAIILADSKGMIIFGNNSVTSLFCYTCDELAGKPLSALLPVTGRIIPSETLQGPPSAENIIETTGLKKDGTGFPVELSISPLQTEGRGYVKIIARDIGKRNKAHDTLQISEARFKNLFESSMDGIYWSDSKGIFLMINQAGAEILGHKFPQEVIGRPVSDYGADPNAYRDFAKELRHKKSVRLRPMKAIRADGAEIDLEASYRILEDEQGNFLGIEGILRDLTEKIRTDGELKKNQAQLQKKHEELNRLFKHLETVKKEWTRSIDCTQDIIILTDKSGRIKRCNKALKEFLSLTYEEILWQDWGELLAEHGLVANTLYGESFELFHGATGRWFVLNSYPFADEHSEISGNVITLHDTSEIKIIEENLRSKNIEINMSRDKLQFALDELSSLTLQVAEKQDFTVRYTNPNLRKCFELMNCEKADCPCYGAEAMRCWQIAGTYCGNIIQGAFAGKYKNCSECPVFKEATSDPIFRIGEHFNHMMYIIEMKNRTHQDAYTKLKETHSKILQQGKMASIGQLAAGIESTINIVWSELKHKVKLKREYGKIPLTTCNAGQLNQAFMNMLGNAAHAVGEQGEVTVKTWNGDGYIHISISDTGCGIPEEKIKRIFEPFFNTREVAKGTGLGPGIASDRVKKHEGEIVVKSKQGAGTTFRVKIPVKIDCPNPATVQNE